MRWSATPKGEVHPQWEPEDREGCVRCHADCDLPARRNDPVDDPSHPAGGCGCGVRRHWGALQRSGYDGPRGPCTARTGTGTRSARLAQALKGPPVGPAPSASGNRAGGHRWRYALNPPPDGSEALVVFFDAGVAFSGATARDRSGVLFAVTRTRTRRSVASLLCPYYRASSCRDDDAGRRLGSRKSPVQSGQGRTRTDADPNSGRLGWGS